jgi:hypothetical protein
VAGAGPSARVDLDAPVRGLLAASREDARGDVGEVEALPAVDALLAGGQREQRRHQPGLLGAERQRLLAGGAQRVRVGVRVGQRDLEQGPFGGQRCAQFVGGVRDEVPLRLE